MKKAIFFIESKIKYIYLWIALIIFIQSIKYFYWFKLEKNKIFIIKEGKLVVNNNLFEILCIMAIAILVYSIIFIRLKELYKKIKIVSPLIFTAGVIFYFFYKLKIIEYKANIDLNKIREMIKGNYSYYIFLFLIYSIPLLLIIILKIFREQRSESYKKNFFERRERDLKYISGILEEENIIGIEGEWGSGKSFFIEKLIGERKVSNRVVKVNLLSLESKEIIPLVLKQLSMILKENGIYYSNSDGIIRFITDNISLKKSFWNIFDCFKNKTLNEEIIEYKANIEDLGKEIIIVFEDFDRIYDKEKILKVLNFGVEFSGKKLKVIYSYDPKELENVDKIFSREYIEKFIPYTKKLTALRFYELFNETISEYKKKNKKIEISKYKFINDIISGRPNKNMTGYNNFIEHFIFEGKFEDEIEILTMRKIETFIKESQYTLEFIENYNIKIDSKIVISFYFIKNLFPKEYDKFKNKFFKIEDNYEINFETNDKKQKVGLNEVNSLLKWRWLYLENNSNNLIKNNVNLIKKEQMKILKIINEKLSLEELNSPQFDMEIKKFLKNSNINKKIISSILVRILFNDYLIFNKINPDFAENLESINIGIRFLYELGNERIITENKVLFYKLLEIFKIEEISERNDLINKKIERCDSEGYQIMSYVGESVYYRISYATVIFGSIREIIKLFEFLETVHLTEFIESANICLKIKNTKEMKEVIITKFLSKKIEIVNLEELRIFEVLILNYLKKFLNDDMEFNKEYLLKNIFEEKENQNFPKEDQLLYFCFILKIEKIKEFNEKS